ncbi:MAG: DNA-protecting protein DprA [Alphaproteobacteria bacterium]|nr:DNA-protecting protein DprA [Alphaproteobacteria bacterium]
MEQIDNAMFNEEQKISWMALARVPGIGPQTFYQLVEHIPTAKEAFEFFKQSASGKAAKGMASSFQTYLIHAQQEYEQCRQRHIAVLGWYEALYPYKLRQITYHPPFIRCLGNSALLNREALAIVGTRGASHAAMTLAKQMAYELSAAGFVCVSGLARGIDTAAHKGSLENGTIAVVAGGLDYIYPPENKSLYDAIALQGLIVSEMPLGTKPLANFFPRRNRIISGLSFGVVVIEAAMASGSLITARYALEQGREVYAVPGFPLDLRSKGPNSLLKEGAILVENASDVLMMIPGYIAPAKNDTFVKEDEDNHPKMQSDVDNIHIKIIQNLNQTPIAVDNLMDLIEEPCERIMSALAELELLGEVERHIGGTISRVY